MDSYVFNYGYNYDWLWLLFCLRHSLPYFGRQDINYSITYQISTASYALELTNIHILDLLDPTSTLTVITATTTSTTTTPTLSADGQLARPFPPPRSHVHGNIESCLFL